jgi:hypothetical protein
MNVMHKLGSLFRALAAVAGAVGAAGAPAQTIAPDSLFGIRIGTLLEAQLTECPKNEKGDYDPFFQKTDKACWVPLQYGKEVRLPQKLWDETRIPFLTPIVTTREGVVVEVAVSAYHDHWRDMERYLVRVYGKPHETKTYKTDSRVFGLSSSRTYTWRANGIALYFNQGQRGDHARIRMVSLAWEALDSKEQEERRQERMRRGNM